MIKSAKKLVFLKKFLVIGFKNYERSNWSFRKNNNLETLITDVASPGGTTEAALEILTKKPNLMAVLNKAILAANERSKILEKNAKKS